MTGCFRKLKLSHCNADTNTDDNNDADAKCRYQNSQIPLKSRKINEPWYIALFMVSGSIKKLSSIDYVNIYHYSIFFNRFCPDEKCGVIRHCFYRDSLTLICFQYTIVIIFQVHIQKYLTLSLKS